MEKEKTREKLRKNATMPPLDPLQNNVVEAIIAKNKNIGRILPFLHCVDTEAANKERKMVVFDVSAYGSK